MNLSENKEEIIRSLEKQIALLSAKNEIQARLAELSVKNSGMEKICEELQSLLHKPFCFLNLTTLEQYPGRQSFLAPDIPPLSLARYKEPLYLETARPDHACVYVQPILSGGVSLGCCLVLAASALTPLEVTILEQGATIAAIELVKNNSLTELYYRKASQIFDELIHTNDPSDLLNKCNELSIDFQANYVSVVLAFTTNIDLQLLELCALRLISSIKQELAGIYQTVFFSQNKITVLVSLKKETLLADFTSRMKKIIAAAQERENIMLSAGMGSLYKGASQIAKSYNEAAKALSYQIFHHHPGLVAYSEIGINKLFLNLPPEDAKDFVQEVFAPLQSPDTEFGGALEETLLAYLDASCSAGRSARKLFIHVNTLYQRLRKIEERLQVSFANPEDLLRLKLAAYLKRYYKS